MPYDGAFYGALALIVGGCMSNNFVLEKIVRLDPGAGPLLTLCQFVVVALEGLLSHVDWSRMRLKQRKQPLAFYAVLTAMFFTLSVINNKAFDYHISQPLHVVFRSSSLAASFFLGRMFFGKTYSSNKLYAVCIVTAGVVLTTFADSQKGTSSNHSTGEVSPSSASSSASAYAADNPDTAVWIVGIAMLFIALVMSAALGHLQAYGYERWGKCDKEGMFYQHALALFFFVFLSGDLLDHFDMWSASAHVPVIPSMLWLPQLWVLAALNVITQYCCIRGVYMLIANAGSLTTTFALTCRKFLSLVLSVWYFNNRWTLFHWMGTLLVFGGVYLYAQSPVVVAPVRVAAASAAPVAQPAQHKPDSADAHEESSKYK